MIKRSELRKIAEARLKDAEILLRSRRYDGAIYICGYAVEISLKERICRTLKWEGYPSTNKEFENYKSLKTHNLDVLLQFSGVEKKVKKKFFVDWSNVSEWNPEARYKSIGSASKNDAKNMFDSTKELMNIL